MVLLCLGLYAVTLNVIPLLMEKGANYTTAALGLGLVGQDRSPAAWSSPPSPPRPVSRSSPEQPPCAILLLALLPGPVPLLIAAAVLAGAVRGCHTLLQATIVADRWEASLGTLQGSFAAPLTTATALAPAAGPSDRSLARHLHRHGVRHGGRHRGRRPYRRRRLHDAPGTYTLMFDEEEPGRSDRASGSPGKRP